MNIDNKMNVYIPLIIENENFAHTKRHSSYNWFWFLLIFFIIHQVSTFPAKV